MDILAGKIDNTFNVHSKSRDERARLLSNFANRPFRINGHMTASVEGFIQGIKFPFDDERRERAFASVGGYAKSFSLWAPKRRVWWNGFEREYGSQEHIELIAFAISAKFDQNSDCMNALLATKGLRLTHQTSEPESPDTSLPAAVFCEILTALRDKQ